MINRLNYEEFFLLYVDDELNHQQRAAVELFVQQNPDIAAEFEMLMDTKVSAEPGIVFADKASLLKKESIAVSTDNYEEFFLLYADNELTAAEKNEVEKFVLQHPQLQQAFTLLMQTVSEPETIVFADKKSLYKKERRVIPLYVSRVAIAAAFIGLIALAWWLSPSGKTNNGVAVNPQTKKEQPVIKPQNNNLPAANQSPQKNNETAIVQAPVKKQTGSSENKIHNTVQLGIKPRVLTEHPLPEKNDVAVNQPAAPLQELNKQDVPDNNIIAKNEPVTKMAAINSQESIIEKPLEEVKNIYAANNDNTNTALPAVYKVLNTDDEDHSLYLGSLQLNKNKVRGLLKKAGSIFGHKNNSSDNGKLQVANMEINTN